MTALGVWLTPFSQCGRLIDSQPRLAWLGRSKMQHQTSRPRNPNSSLQNQGSSASLIELALIIVLIAIIVLAILLIIGDDLRLWVVQTLQSFLNLLGK
jgi:hypothetical protein